MAIRSAVANRLNYCLSLLAKTDPRSRLPDTTPASRRHEPDTMKLNCKPSPVKALRLGWLSSGVLACSIALGGAGLADESDGASRRERPNFIVFIADDAAWDDFGTYGNPTVRTPTIDGLAANGLRFDRAYLTCSSCSPSRCSILTSRYPHATGAGELHMPLPPEQIMITTPLRDSGYHTVAAGKWHLGDAAKQQFDRVLDSNGGPGNHGRWLEAIQERPDDQPFFAWLASSDPHRGYKPNAVTPPHDPSQVRVPAIFPDTPEVRRDVALYYDEITRFDEAIGTIVTALRESNELDNTVLFVMSDNGRPFPHCKTRVNVDGVRTPLVVHWPAGLRDHGATEALVSSIDVTATILELAEASRPPSIQGVSFAPVFSDHDAQVRRFAFAEHNWHDYRARERAVYTQDHVLIVNHLPQLPATPPADGVRSATYLEMMRLHDAGQLTGPPMDVFMEPRPAISVHDVASDPHCLLNLAEDGAWQSTRENLQAALEAFTALTNDQWDGDIESLTPDGFDRQTGLRITQGRRPTQGKKKANGKASAK